MIGADGTARIRSVPTMIESGSYRLGVRFRGRTAETDHTITVPNRRSPLRMLRKLTKRG
jgi:hypothetical protein